MNCSRCKAPAIGKATAGSDLPQDVSLCESCNLNQTTVRDPTLVAESVFDEEDADNPSSMVMSEGGGGADVEELSPVLSLNGEVTEEPETVPEEPKPTEMEMRDGVCVEDGGVSDQEGDEADEAAEGLSVEDFITTQIATLESMEKEEFKQPARTVMDCVKAASKTLSLGSRCRGGMGGSSSGGAAYGEVTVGSIVDILEALHVDERDVFLDIGAGVGIVPCLASEVRLAKASIGIESHPDRAYIAQNFLAEVIARALKNSDSEDGVVLHAKVAVAKMDVTTLNCLDPVTKAYCFSTGMPPVVIDRVCNLLTNTPTLQNFIIFHDMTAYDVENKDAFRLVAKGSARLVGSSTTRTWYHYERMEKDIEPVRSDFECVTCGNAINVSPCEHCRMPCCISHFEISKHEGSLCELSYVASQSALAQAYLQSCIHDFGEVPETLIVRRRLCGKDVDGDSAVVSSSLLLARCPLLFHIRALT